MTKSGIERCNPWPTTPEEIHASAQRFATGQTIHELKRESRYIERMAVYGSFALLAALACDVFVLNGPFIRFLVRLAVGP
ncbi:hypothetical protein EON81_24195 [bacterium]|nr:MAG: hypothetical protein EON81_24195 [bacterium]